MKYFNSIHIYKEKEIKEQWTESYLKIVARTLQKANIEFDLYIDFGEPIETDVGFEINFTTKEIFHPLQLSLVFLHANYYSLFTESESRDYVRALTKMDSVVLKKEIPANVLECVKESGKGYIYQGRYEESFDDHVDNILDNMPWEYA